ncbi:hypothetical protein OGAPHI_002204 [Ogataea philodendri]|uniref:Putative tyrosine-protein phosphatase OCA1 n=1 Tax=Ogataea philodendri TaxID=1378263 RepID=A0A9P8T7R4_9ASCO|nr:uncharacterized protein OGAPHI_002204 [Ogataea philodendri]KAH3668450.1 hypothetical protein OGAPHI_002204 [Ogataea philodendri]
MPEPFTPPIKFAKVQNTVSRGAYPRPINYRYLETLNLKTMIALTAQDISMENDPSLYSFCTKNNINLVHIETDSSSKDKGKKRGIPIEPEQVLRILELILDKKSSPVYIFCNNGGQITSLAIACLRKIQLWNLVSIYDEFVNYSTTINQNDRAFIESFKARIQVPPSNQRVDWIWKGMSSSIVQSHPNMQFVSFEEDNKLV